MAASAKALTQRFTALPTDMSIPDSATRSADRMVRHLHAPFAKLEAGASVLLRDRIAGRADAGTIGAIVFEQPNSERAKFGWLPRSVSSL